MQMGQYSEGSTAQKDQTPQPDALVRKTLSRLAQKEVCPHRAVGVRTVTP